MLYISAVAKRLLDEVTRAEHDFLGTFLNPSYTFLVPGVVRILGVVWSVRACLAFLASGIKHLVSQCSQCFDFSDNFSAEETCSVSGVRYAIVMVAPIATKNSLGEPHHGAALFSAWLS